ncbi:MAG: hypothetical protein ACKPKO_60130, partial [Candidatus Fonsibacter sp.]
YDKAKHKGLLQYWMGAPDDQGSQRQGHQSAERKLTTRGTKEFKQLYRICMTDAHFKERELKAPGYMDGIYILDWTTNGARTAQPTPQIQKRPRSGRPATRSPFSSSTALTN